jgi:hypothetical protein
MEERLRALEIQFTALRGDLTAHEKYCDARWRVAWKFVTGMSALVAAVVSIAIALARP